MKSNTTLRFFNDDFSYFDTEVHDWFLNPVVTPTAVKDIREAYQLTKDVTTYNAVLDRVYKATLDFMTVSFAGRQRLFAPFSTSTSR